MISEANGAKVTGYQWKRSRADAANSDLVSRVRQSHAGVGKRLHPISIAGKHLRSREHPAGVIGNYDLTERTCR